MTHTQVTRRLAAILAADVVGYSKMMGEDEAGTHARIGAMWREVFNPTVADHHGRVVKTMGDGALVEFASVVESVNCALAIQKAMAERNAAGDGKKPVELRIGVNLGDIVIEGDDIFGDGVNVAARLEGQAPPGGVLTSDVVHAQVRGKVNVTFVDAGEIDLKNIERPVRVWRWHGDKSVRQPLGGAGSSSDKRAASANPSLAVLPFATMSSDPEQEFFADGLVEDLITTLSKLPGLTVIARNSTFTYKGKSVDVRQVARELGVSHVMEGSVRKGGNRIRVTAQLIEAATGTHVWAERFDRDLADMFAVQDEISLRVATEMQVRLTEGDQARMRYTTTHNVEAWTYWMQGRAYVNDGEGPTPTKMMRIRTAWEKALALDPESASLNASLAFIWLSNARWEMWGPRQEAIATAVGYMERALEVDPNNADALVSKAMLRMGQERFDEGVELARKAAAMAPSSSDVLAYGALVFTSAGLNADAASAMERSIILNPRHAPHFLGNLGNAYRLLGRLDEAIETLEEYHRRAPRVGVVDLVIAYEEAGRHEEALGAAKRVLAARPQFTVASWVKAEFRKDKDELARDVAMLRAAGLPG